MAPLGSEVMTTSASVTASAPVSNTFAPVASAAAFRSATGSKPRTANPPATRFAAIGPPMLPSPKNAIVVISSSLPSLRWPKMSLLGRRPRPGGFGPADDDPHYFVGSLEDSMHPQVADDLLQSILAQIA